MNGQSARDSTPGVSGAADTWPLSARDAAAVLGISERTVRRAIGRGDLVAAKHGGVFRIDPAEVARFKRRTRKPPFTSADQYRSEPKSVEARDLASELGHALSVIHDLTGHEARSALHGTLASQWEVLSIVQQLCASCLAAGLNNDRSVKMPPVAPSSAETWLTCEYERLGVDRFSNEMSCSCGQALTRREMDVLQLVAMGESNREIANALFISVPTVKRHLTNILGKLGVSNRYEAGLVAKFGDLT